MTKSTDPEETPVTTATLLRSTTATTSTLPKSTTATSTASDPACPLFSIPTDSLTFDDSPTWNPNDAEYVGDIVASAYAIWQVDSGDGSEILPPLQTSTEYGDAVLIGFIPGAGNAGNSTTGVSSTATITSLSGAVLSSAEVGDASAASITSMISALSAKVASVQSNESVESVASVHSALSVESVAAARSVAVLEIVAAIQSQASINNPASAQSVASVVSVLSVASVASSIIAPLPTLIPNLAILIVRNDYCSDASCSSTGYIYDTVPSKPIVSVCSNPPYIHTFTYSEDVSNEARKYAIDTGRFTSHGVYTSCRYQGSGEWLGMFSCDQVEGVFCSLPTEQASNCTDSHSLNAVPVIGCLSLTVR